MVLKVVIWLIPVKKGFTAFGKLPKPTNYLIWFKKRFNMVLKAFSYG